ncbi:class I SAM-dependent methyltransferase [Lacticaseibacillus camelliae]|uniref:Modification methylase LaaG n=1 Tax=Lacticaseibacillus camelliae DSM 22697 = JCM 13995 TaxID=1423730 RepID=A0A0R2FM84_9LACO|nr:class I SAM-dependent methyltransferase [Lacticaseibacillus camelliae]KRN25348.1 modification methylase LaaG [Lacticaseibacillus camelliae DSM 22697 = JCM 13995]
MANEHMESLYQALDQATSLLHKQVKTTYLEAATEAGEDLQSGTINVQDGVPDQATVEKLTALFKPVDLTTFSAEECRQALQLVLVKAIQIDGIEPNKQVTPDAMAELATFIASVFLKPVPKQLTVADLAVGTGNLLFAVMNQLKTALGAEVKGVGVDNDETLLAFAGMSSQLQHQDVDLLHEDALGPLATRNADLIVSDLPVGYYPLDERAKQFATAAKKGHSYAHHLLIEQSLRALKAGGLGLFFVPSTVFQSEEAAGLTAWLTSSAHFQGLLNLPQSLFAKASAQKSLLVLQKPGQGTKQAKQVLLGSFPELTDRDAFSQFIDSVHSWAAQNLA